MQPRVYSYIRFSDARQAAGASVARQAEFAARWAADHGMVLDTSLSMRDEGLSAYHQRHVRKGALGVFLRAVEDRLVPPGSVLLVESLDRLSRAEPLTALGQLTGIIDAGVAVVTASDGRTYTRDRLKADPMQLMHSLLVMIRAHEESETKSKRVRDAIRRQCRGWQAGTYRGLIRYGQAPGWLRVEAGRWALIPERAAAVRLAVDLALSGIGLGGIAQQLHAQGLRTSDVEPTSGHLARILCAPALIGRKTLKLDGDVFELEGYYPAVIDAETFATLQTALAGRARGPVRASGVPSVLTGSGVAVCGYCGAPLKAQTMESKRRADGTLADSHRRLQCTRNNAGACCLVPGSCSAAPVERAVIRWCSDLLNLRSLQANGAGAAARAQHAQAVQRRDTLQAQLQRLADALLESTDPPAAFLARGRELEAQLAAADADVTQAEGALHLASRASSAGADERWQAVAAGVDALDPTARLQARQLVVDTFARIAVHHSGIRPGEQPPGTLDVVLVAHSGVTRLLRVTRAGDLVAVEDWPQV